MYRHVVSVAVNDPKSLPLYRFKLVNLCFREQSDSKLVPHIPVQA